MSIDVLNLSSQEGYELFDIDVGDKTFICDEEFFGYDIIGNERTLHKESFVVSEINDVLDNQTESTITVQNFRTQFEDLFSRISATIQTVQTKDMIYSRGENFTANGEILVSVLQQTLLNNALTIAQSVNNNVIIEQQSHPFPPKPPLPKPPKKFMFTSSYSLNQINMYFFIFCTFKLYLWLTLSYYVAF